MNEIRPIELREGEVLYERVADRLQGSIEAGTLQPGDRIPSVRKLKAQLSVSASTVLEAYRLLEDRGLVEAKPRSGYFVKAALRRLPDEPTPSISNCRACAIDLSLAMQVYAAAVNAPNAVQLGAAVPSLELLPTRSLDRLMSRVLRQQSQVVHEYGSVLGRIELRHEIARRLLDAGCSVFPDEIVVTNGTTEALSLSLQAVTKPGDAIAVESPTYYGLLEALASLHLQVLELPTHPREGICLDALETALRSRAIAACVLVSNFSNPLGNVLSDEKKQRLAELAAQYETPIVEDDVYGDLSFEGFRPKAIKAFDRGGWVMYCASFSKTLSPGWRIGWSIPGRFQSRVEQHKLAKNYATANAPQLAIAAFLNNGGYDRHLRRLRSAYRTQVMQTTQAVCEFFPPGTKVTRPTGGHILWVELPEGTDSLVLYELAFERDIHIAPGVMFSPSGQFRNCLRLNCAFPVSQEIYDAVKTLGILANSIF
ncbi:Transcriptional regulator GntR family domain / Aspartate aminotransferase [Geitlerinema sp. FC II]|nr:PLP-dependent aminotransferase family protein [Geitlerinema sp. CS-897]PPT11361.1 Transcriptional regulator GntR family domain / Aspartate aminotransferase [Geitlerinema sp. FC II]